MRVAMPSSFAVRRLSPRVWRSVSWITRISISASGMPIGNVSDGRRGGARRRVADLARQRVLVDHGVTGAREHDGALDRVLELAHVAGPAVLGEALERGRRAAGDRLAVLLGVDLDEVLREQRDVVAAIAQRRHVHRDHVEAVVEVLAEPAAP